MAGARRAVVSTRGAQLTGLLAVIYGVGVAFGNSVFPNEGFWRGWLMVGAVIVGILFLVTMVIPFVRNLLSGGSDQR